MPLILAIEPDRRQANQLTAMVRGRLHAELVLADSAEPALEALGDRVPDLILTSALLSTKDETMLGDRLRQLDGAAAHVQTLTIPVLATPQPRSMPGRGVLSALLGDRPSSPAAPDGCDPGVFAEQCKAYLERAAAERDEHHAVETRVEVEPPPKATEPPPLPPVPVQTVAAPPEPPESLEPLESIAEPIAERIADPPIAEHPITRSPMPITAAAEEPPEVDLSSMLDETVVRQLSEAIQTVALEPPPSPRAATLVPRDRHPRPSSPPPASFVAGTKRGERQPIQDEWGFFDPAQCGFAALLAKLDEITHVASPLPAKSHSAGSRTVNR